MALAIGSDFALFSTQSECLKLYWITPFSSSDWHKIKEDKKKRLKELETLQKTGILTIEEFEKLKHNLLN